LIDPSSHLIVLYSATTPGLLRQSPQLLDVLAQTLQISLVIRALDEIHLAREELPLIGPLGIRDTLPVLAGLAGLLLSSLFTHGRLVVYPWCLRLCQNLFGLVPDRRRCSLTLRDGLLTREAGSLALAAAASSGALGLTGEDRATCQGIRLLFVVMHPFHVIEQVISTRKAVAGNAALAAWIVADMGPVSVPMHTVCFSLMSQETGRG